MKTLTLIFLLMPFWALNSLGQNADVAGLLNKPETRTEIFNTIMNDHQLMMEFMNAMQDNDHALMMMKQNHSMMNQAEEGSMQMGEGNHMMGMNNENSKMSQSMGMNNENSEINHMMEMMRENPELMPNMMGNMLEMCKNDSTMCNQMAEVMSSHPHMMQMSIQKMNENRMMNSNGNMKMMDSDTPMKSSNHHGNQ